MVDNEDLPPAVGPADEERREAIAAIQRDDASSSWSAPESALDFGSMKWAPALVGKDNRLLHLSLTGDIPKVFRRRMLAAAANGVKVYFATAATGLDLNTLTALQEVDARIVVLESRDNGYLVTERRSVADWIAMHGIALSPSDCVALIQQLLTASAGAGTNAARGRWYEEALCLLFSQVSWLRIDEHAYHNESEEIDIVMSVHAAGFLLQLAGGPIVVATAKNEAKATGSPVVKYLKEQMANRKGRCKLGFLCSASTISQEAKNEILRGSQGNDLVIVPLDKATLDALIARPDRLDEQVEALITKAVAD